MAKRRKGPAKKQAAKKQAEPKQAAEEPKSAVGEPKQAAEKPKQAAAAPKPEPKLEPAKPKQAKLPPAPEPTFWFGFEVSWAKLALARVVLFGLLAVDALMQIRHAPRYGAGGFNVGNLGIFDSLGPTRGSYQVAELLNAYLFVLAACGVATRLAIPAAAAIYGWLYFGSQLDSYQHHYLVSMVLVVACFVPWRKPGDATPTTRIRTWAVRLLLIEVAIMYLWAAISKMAPAWLDGRTLGAQIGGTARQLIDSTVGIKLASLSVIAVELGLAATIWIPRAWRFAAPVGILFHLGILATTLEIGLFAWIMLGIYTLALPDAFCLWLAETAPVVVLREQWTALERRASREPWLVWLVAVATSVVLAVVCRFHHALVVGCVLAVVPVMSALVLRGSRRLAWVATAHLLAFATWTMVDRTTTLAVDYYKYWGGNARRLGDKDGAERAYRELIELEPDQGNAHYQLGQLLLARGDEAEGLDELHAAQRLEPKQARPFTAEARWLAARGRRDEAIGKARAALAADPTNPDARAVLDSLTGAAPVRPAKPDDDEPK
jgi:hypothetical protein